MNVYLIKFRSYPPRKIIADNIIEAINKYKANYMKNKIDCNTRLNDITSITYIEEFDYIN